MPCLTRLRCECGVFDPRLAAQGSESEADADDPSDPLCLGPAADSAEVTHRRRLAEAIHRINSHIAKVRRTRDADYQIVKAE